MLLELNDAYHDLMKVRAALRLAKRDAKTDEERRLISRLLEQTNEPADTLRRLTQPKEG